MSRRFTSVFLGLALVLALPALGAEPEQPSPPRKWVEPRATEILRQMSDRLVAASRFAFEAEETFDEIPDGEPRQQLTNVRRVGVQRPDRLAADATGDTRNRAVWYDGHTLTVLDKDHNSWAQVDAPATIDGMLDMIAQRYQIEVPLADLVYANPYAVLAEGVTYGRYLGIHLAAGVRCYHLAFAQETIEWQIWIDAGSDPLPRKLAITYVNEPGEPQYVATFRKWTFEPKFTDTIFHFEPPEGSKHMELKIGGGLGPAEGGRAAEPVPAAPARPAAPASRRPAGKR